VDVRGALIVLGSVCPALAVLAWLRLRAIDRSMRRRDDELMRLRAVPMLQALPVPVMDHLARNLIREHVAPGQDVFKLGERGDRFYVVAAGQADMFGNGRRIRTLRSGDSFGEIALCATSPGPPRFARARRSTSTH
jgi:CRP-like cAMP-binding protein